MSNIRTEITDLKIKIDQFAKEKINVILDGLSNGDLSLAMFECELRNLYSRIMSDVRMKEYMCDFILKSEYINFYQYVDEVCKIYIDNVTDVEYLKYLAK